MKRFYKAAGVGQAEDGWRVTLDGRPVRTPKGRTLTAPNRAAAEAVAAEWEAQSETVDPHAMPLTRLLNVALDRAGDAREGLVAEFGKYGETDLVCHLAEAPEELCARQDAAWTPLRDWAAEHGVALIPTAGIVAEDQPEESLARLRELAGELDDVRLTLLVHLAAHYGSAVLALAALKGRLNAEDALTLSLIEAHWQRDQWGADEEALQREAAVAAEIAALARLIDALEDTRP